MISIYTSAYNLSSNIYDWRNALDSFSKFADQVSIATFAVQLDNSVKWLEDYCVNNPKCILELVDITKDDPEFDGKLKNAALQKCTGDHCILLDLDEKIPIEQRNNWNNLCQALENSGYDAVFIPVFDLFHTEKEYKSLNYKWYLHKNKIGLRRGVVNFARKVNGKIDINKSDTTELIRYDGSLCNSVYLINPQLDENAKLNLIKEHGIYVFHYGWLYEAKKKSSVNFWNPVWSNRCGDIIINEIDFSNISYNPHNL